MWVQVKLQHVHEEHLRPLRQFLLGPMYCPEFGLSGEVDDPRLRSYLDNSRHMKSVNLLFNQLRFCRPLTRWQFAMQERKWEHFPEPLTSVFQYVSQDGRILIQAISEREFQAFSDMITFDRRTSKSSSSSGVDQRQSYAAYVRNNPETLLPKVIGCYKLEHAGLRLKE